MDIKKVREVIKNHQAQEIDGMLLDAQTAQIIDKVYRELSPETQVKANKMELSQVARICWGLTTMGDKELLV